MADRTNIEIEFKCLITKDKYEYLLNKLGINKENIKSQVNYYFDTKTLDLRSKHIMCRIRQKGEQYKITVKTKNASDDNVENHFYLTPDEAITAIKNGLDGSYANYDGIIHNIATLKTNRVWIPYKGGKLFIDESVYGNKIDYEIEYEVTAKDEGQKIFDEFLKENEIDFNEPISKSARCFKEAGYLK